MGAFESALAGLNEAQRKAVTTTEGPVLVIAGPGTGKTQLLSTRIAYILSTTDTLPENILCLTFTDSAAQNMRQRLSNMIGQAAYKITISTYHAFGSDLIKRFPEYFTLGARLEPIDDLGIDSTLRQIIADLPYDNPLKFADNYLGNVKSFISDAKRALLTPDDIRQTAQSNLNFIEQASPVVSASLKDLVRVTGKSIPMFDNLAADLHVLLNQNPPDKSNALIMPLGAMLLKDLQQALAVAYETGKTATLTKWKGTWLEKNSSGQFVAGGTKANKKLLACADIYQQYLDSLESHQLFDYDDMILRAVSALQKNDDLRFTLQEQYQYILLDEFQDTNGAQLRLVELLTDNPVLEGRPNVLAVGDDDQAIYAFQGADYSHMLQFKKLYRDVLPVALTQNYRSHQDVLHTARGIAGQIEERLHHHFPEIEKTLTADNPNLPDNARIERREAKSDIDQFAWATRKISELIDNGLSPSEIAVLAPQHKYLEPLVAFLQNAKIPVRYEKRENILDDPVVNQLVVMTNLCLSLQAKDAKSSALWSEVLSFPFWQLPTSLVWQLSWQASQERKPWIEILQNNEQTKQIALFFIRLSMMAEREPLEIMLDYLIGTRALDLQEPEMGSFTSPLRKFYFDNPSNLATSSIEFIGSFWDTLTSLTILRDKLREHSKQSQETVCLANLITFVEAHRAANIKILNSSPHQDNAQAVQLMTAYKSKGMEFEAVLVLAANDEAWGGKSTKNNNQLVLPANLSFIRYKGATADERLRLFYVALTRAKTNLYILSYQANYSGKQMTRLQYLNETDEAGGVVSPLLPQGQQKVLRVEDTGQTPAGLSDLETYWQQRHLESVTHPTGQNLLQSRLENFQLSPTHVNAYVDLEHGGPRQFFINTILRFPQSLGASGQFGNAMHETLEWIHNQNKLTGKIPGKDAAIANLGQQLHAKHLSPDDLKQLAPKGKHAISTYLEQRAHTIQAGNRCEYDFRFEGVFIGKAHLTGKIDKLIIDDASKTIAIVDYKTGRGHTRWTASTQMHKYRQQLYLYKALVEGSSRFRGYQVTDAYLEFVVPDEEGRIHELHLDFDDDTFVHIKRLTQAVWHNIQALNFPETSQFSKNLQGIQQFERHLIDSATDI